MSQTIFTDIDPTLTSGNQLATYLNDFKAAILTGFSGTMKPTETGIGGYWIDTSSAGYLIFRLWDGVQNVEVFRIDLATHATSISGADGSFAITKISADTVAPFLDLIKSRIANDGQVLTGDYLGSVRFSGHASDGSIPIAARIRVIARENFTGSASGADIVFESTAAGTAAIAEGMRLRDGRLGIGTNDPQDTIHALGTGVRAEKASDDAVGARLVLKKRRIAGNGSIQSGDILSEVQIKSADDVSASVDVAKIISEATEAHSSTAHGTKMTFQIARTGEITLTSMIELALSGIKSLVNHDFGAKISSFQVVDSATTGADQSVSVAGLILKVTNAGLTSINNIASPIAGQLAILINGTGGILGIKNNVGGTAGNRILTGTGVDLAVGSGASVWIVYDAAASRWQVVGGSGGGGSVLQGSRQTGTSISAGTAITPTIGQETLSFVVGNGGPVTVTATPPVTTSGMTIGQKLRIVGTSDANPVTYNPGVNLVLNGSVTLAKDQSVDLQYMGTDGTNEAWVETGRTY